MATLERALEIAARAHAGTVDHHQQPYILHPLRVMMGVDDPVAQIVAILHDVVEDTSVTFDDLRREGFSLTVLDALELVTHESGTPYADYVIACRPNPIARQVKLADLRDNSRIDRAILREEKLGRDLKRMRRYVLSYQYLMDQLTESEYRERMVDAEK